MHQKLKPNFYSFYGRGGLFKADTERAECLPQNEAALNANNKLNLERGTMRGKAILPYKINYINIKHPGRPESSNK